MTLTMTLILLLLAALLTLVLRLHHKMKRLRTALDCAFSDIHTLEKALVEQRLRSG